MTSSSIFIHNVGVIKFTACLSPTETKSVILNVIHLCVLNIFSVLNYTFSFSTDPKIYKEQEMLTIHSDIITST